jgi:hypothetical protein
MIASRKLAKGAYIFAIDRDGVMLEKAKEIIRTICHSEAMPKNIESDTQSDSTSILLDPSLRSG